MTRTQKPRVPWWRRRAVWVFAGAFVLLTAGVIAVVHYRQETRIERLVRRLRQVATTDALSWGDKAGEALEDMGLDAIADLVSRSDGPFAELIDIGVPAVPYLIPLLADADRDVQKTAAYVLDNIPDPGMTELLIEAMGSEDVGTRRWITILLGSRAILGDGRAFETLAAALDDADATVRRRAAWEIGKAGGPGAIQPLSKALSDDDEAVREAAAYALALTSIRSLLGRKIPQTFAANPGLYLTMTAGGNFSEAFDFMVNRVSYTLAVDGAGAVTYISTADKGFTSPEGATVGDTYQTVKKLGTSALVCERGWAFYLPLPSGWNAAFVQGYTMTEGDLSDGAKVKWFFVRQ